MSRNAKLHEALLRLAAKFEYGELMAETQPAAFIDSVVERLGKLEATLAEVVAEAGALGHDGYHEDPLDGATVAKALALLKPSGVKP